MYSSVAIINEGRCEEKAEEIAAVASAEVWKMAAKERERGTLG